MIIKKLKVNGDSLGIITSIACAIHCAVLPALVSTLPLLGIDILENKAVEWTMISLAFVFGTSALHHGYTHHHKRVLPLVLFIFGFSCLVVNQVIAERFVLLLIPASTFCIISSHVFNIYYCRLSGKCSKPQSRKAVKA